MRIRFTKSALIAVAVLGCAAWVGILGPQLAADDSKTIVAAKSTAAGNVPTFQVDPFWPKPLPHNWQIGDVANVFADSKDHIWISHRPHTLDDQEKGASTTPPVGDCCIPAPPIIEFDPEGTVVQAWGGANPTYEWPENEHGVNVDYKDNVWVTAADTPTSAQVLKFTRDGKFIMQIGHVGQSKGNKDTANFGQPAMTLVDPSTNELFVADGHHNRRVMVMDADTGAFKRMWGAYGEQPEDSQQVKYDPSQPPQRQFSSVASVHCIRMTKEGEIYICDRNNDRFQVFKKDGTFVKEVLVNKQSMGLGTVVDLVFSPDEKFIYVADTTDAKVWILRKDNDQVVGSFGRQGRYAGQFHFLHDITIDSKGNIYTGEASGSKRVQRFKFTGMVKYNPSAAE
jgi:DNA-binding beta-propeller fold protein YncE